MLVKDYIDYLQREEPLIKMKRLTKLSHAEGGMVFEKIKKKVNKMPTNYSVFGFNFFPFNLK